MKLVRRLGLLFVLFGAGCSEARQEGADTSPTAEVEVVADAAAELVDAAPDLTPDAGEGGDLAPDAAAGDEDLGLADWGGDAAAQGPRIVSNFETFEVPPQSRVHLSVAMPEGREAPARYQWSVVQPAGSVSTFVPNAIVANPSFELNVAGEYLFHVALFDAEDRELGAASMTLRVVPPASLHVELLWRTPGDPNESDTGVSSSGSAGSDLDLHFLDGSSGATWFDASADCYWNNPAPSTGHPSPWGAPSLDRDDTDGAGPENLNVVNPAPRLYDVGVHYFSDWGYGPAFASVRVYVHGVLVDEWADVELVHGDLWHSHRIDWATGAVMRVIEGGQPHVLPAYPVPDGSY